MEPLSLSCTLILMSQGVDPLLASSMAGVCCDLALAWLRCRCQGSAGVSVQA